MSFPLVVWSGILRVGQGGVFLVGGEGLGEFDCFYIRVIGVWRGRVVVGVAFPSNSIHRCGRKMGNLRVTRDVDSHLTRSMLTYNIGNRACSLKHPVGRSTSFMLCG